MEHVRHRVGVQALDRPAKSNRVVWRGHESWCQHRIERLAHPREARSSLFLRPQIETVPVAAVESFDHLLKSMAGVIADGHAN
jgi:hypothetical protein